MNYTKLSISADRAITLCGTNVYPTPEVHPNRTMNEHDFLYIFKGEQGVAQDDEAFTLQAGDLMLLRAGAHHYGISPTAVGTQSVFIHFSRLAGDKQVVPPPGDKKQLPLDDAPHVILPTVLHIGQGTPATQLIHAILSAYWSHEPNKRRRSVLLFNLLLDELSVIASATHTTQDEWSTSVINLFHRHPSQMFSLEEIAEMVGMNVRTLSTRFRQITGQSIHQYQLNYKLELAYKQLRTGAATVKDVAMSLGFCDAYYFSRQFKKKFGVPPKEIKGRDPSANINRQPVV